MRQIGTAAQMFANEHRMHVWLGHRGKINILFMDFHAEKFDISPQSNASSLSAVKMAYGFPGDAPGASFFAFAVGPVPL